MIIDLVPFKLTKYIIAPPFLKRFGQKPYYVEAALDAFLTKNTGAAENSVCATFVYNILGVKA
jgi:hypothetical protein